MDSVNVLCVLFCRMYQCLFVCVLVYSFTKTVFFDETMSGKQSKEKPLGKRKRSTTTETQKKIVFGYIRQAFLSQNLRDLIIPQDVVNIIYALVTFRDHISLAVIGHVDSGKSTLCGKILEETELLYARTLDKIQTHANEMGKPSHGLAFCLDKTRDERCRALTILGSTKYEFKVGTSQFTLIDTPGHR